MKPVEYFVPFAEEAYRSYWVHADKNRELLPFNELDRKERDAWIGAIVAAFRKLSVRDHEGNFYAEEGNINDQN